MNERKKDSEEGKAVVFEFYAPQAKRVQLAGSFNSWDPATTPLRRSRDGKWKAALKLPPGRYEYRFWVDGHWHNDPSRLECVPNPFGTWNCVIEIA